MNLFHRIVRRINDSLAVVGGVFLLAMIALTCGNILLRPVWVPIPGAFELMGFFGAVVGSFALGYTQIHRGHIAVDVLVAAFSRRTQRVLQGINSLVCAAFFGMAAWQAGAKAGVLMTTGEVAETLRIAYYPFTYGVAVGCGGLALVFLSDLAAVIWPQKDARP
jgi:TRAP-type C4-dicarboxylate transport system permease small subunit